MRPRDLLDIVSVPLSDEQLEAATAPLEPGVIIAGAGTGKTSVMAARVVWLMTTGEVEPDQILGLTFTRKATAELLSRVRSSINEAIAKNAYTPKIADTEIHELDGAGDPTILTYNAFAASVLVDNAILLGMEPESNLLSETARMQRAYRVACNAPSMIAEIRSPASAAAQVIRLDEELASLDVHPDELIAFDERLLIELENCSASAKVLEKFTDTAKQRREYARLVKDFRAAKIANEEYDFSDHIRLALELASTFPNIGASLRERYRVVLLDEYQDSSIAQRRLMQRLFGDGHPVTAVGDPLQSIYEWRGASTSNIVNFPKHFPKRNAKSSERFTLTSNRRSAPAVIALANELADELRAEYAVDQLVAGATGKGAGDVVCAMFETSHDEAEYIANDIARRGSYNSTAVMARNGKHLRAVHAALIERGIPVQFVGTAALLETPEALDLRAMIEAVYDPIANPAMLRVLTGARYRIGERDLAILGRRAADLAEVKNTLGATSSVEEALDEAVAGIDDGEIVSLSDAVLSPGDPSEYAFSAEALTRFSQLAGELRYLRRHVSDPLPDFVRRVLTTIGLLVETEATEHRLVTGSRESLDAFLALVNTFSDLDNHTTIGAFLERLRDTDRFDTAEEMEFPARSNAVVLMTLHKSKGLEFENVYVPGVVEREFPNTQGNGRWPTSPKVVPLALRDDAPDELLGFPKLDAHFKNKDHEEWKERSKRLEQLEELRLLYVAITRAEKSIMFSGSHYDVLKEKETKPSAYLLAVKQACESGLGEVVRWDDAPEDPSAMVRTRVNQDAADVVACARAVTAMRGEPTAPAPLDDDRVRQWDRDIETITAQSKLDERTEITVKLPDRLSTSALVRLADNPTEFARELARPMPRKPSQAARRGTAFHAAIEHYYQASPLITPEDLPGSADSDIETDELIPELRAMFEKSAYAQRMPVAIEEPFALVLNGRVIPGRIDAVFRNDNGTYEVVDWKTGGTDSTHALQLAVYRLAWAEHVGVPLDQVRASFVMLRTGEVVSPVELADRAELEALLG